ncbi:MAG: reverse transcriptase domain-containing protein [Candidatus Accumulibacter necessarius]|uniref:reverse transcriptase domain-containing protein n=1 Tax=Candidatus Accumulibacter necessarius TaxID=2954386 RepID=UPI002FC3C815
MSVGVNQSFVRLALGCIQPASAEQIAAFISSSLPTGAHPLHAEKIREVLDGWASSGDILCVHKRYLLYSLTRQGDGKLSAPERKVRDRTRMFLLKDLRSASLRASEVWGIEQADDSSAVSHGMAVQEDERPIGAAVSPRRRDGRAYWPLLSKQLLVGSSSPSSDTRFRFLSFSSVRSCSQACGYADIPEGGIGLNEISLALGVSPRIVGLLLRRPESHYRLFQIPKAGGGLREIHAPRTFMKVTQHFILDYLLRRLKVHPAATAYSIGCSIRHNAEIHVRRRYVANIDVTNFFGSLSTSVVYDRLIAVGLMKNTAAFIARISSFMGGLPQGAPTSAALSNICLYAVDDVLQAESTVRQVTYSRYADDITFSGDDLGAVQACMAIARRELSALGLTLNTDKTRVFGPSSRQVVTGVVVNEHAQPARKERRRLRAMLHHAGTAPDEFVAQFDILQGKSSYMLSYSTPERGIGALPEKYVEDALAAVRAARKKGLPAADESSLSSAPFDNENRGRDAIS